MNSSNFRAEARNELKGNWGKAACLTLAYFIIFFIISFIENLLPDDSAITGLFSILATIIEIPLGFGFIFSMLKLFKKEDIKAFDFLSLGFSNFGKSWLIVLQTILKLILPIILMIISYILIAFGSIAAIGTYMYSVTAASSFSALLIIGIILLIVSTIWFITKSYYYPLSFIIAIENPEMTSKEAVLKSQELMEGNRWKLFCLQFSFIGWAILGAFTLGIGYLWLIPYIQFATIIFYKFVNGDNSNVEVEVVTDNDDNSTEE